MLETDRVWFEQQITDMASEHSKALNEAEHRGYWSALRRFDRDVVAKVTTDTTGWSRLIPKAFDLQMRAVIEANRTQGFESPRDYVDDSEFADPPTPEQRARVRALVQNVCKRRAAQ